MQKVFELLLVYFTGRIIEHGWKRSAAYHHHVSAIFVSFPLGAQNTLLLIYLAVWKLFWLSYYMGLIRYAYSQIVETFYCFLEIFYLHYFDQIYKIINFVTRITILLYTYCGTTGSYWLLQWYQYIIILFLISFIGCWFCEPCSSTSNNGTAGAARSRCCFPSAGAVSIPFIAVLLVVPPAATTATLLIGRSSNTSHRSHAVRIAEPAVVVITLVEVPKRHTDGTYQ